MEISKSCGVKIVNGEKCSPKKFRQNHDAPGEQLRGFQACDCDLHALRQVSRGRDGETTKVTPKKVSMSSAGQQRERFPKHCGKVFICFPNFHMFSKFSY